MLPELCFVSKASHSVFVKKKRKKTSKYKQFDSKVENASIHDKSFTHTGQKIKKSLMKNFIFCAVIIYRKKDFRIQETRCVFGTQSNILELFRTFYFRAIPNV